MSSISDSTATAVTLTTTSETALVTTPVIPENNTGNQGMRVSGMINVTTGTGVTAVVVRVRAGSGLSGSVVGVAQTHTVGASVSASIPYSALDPTLVSPGLQYTVSIQQTGATGNGTVNLAEASVQPSNQFVG